MRYIGYRWEELPYSCDARASLNVIWQSSAFQYSLDDMTLTTAPTGRELLVFEGDAELIRAVQKAAESVTKSVAAPKKRKA